MRVSADPSTWRAQSIIRRDFRSGRFEPEVPKHFSSSSHHHPRPTSSCVLSPSKLHSPVRVVSKITRKKLAATDSRVLETTYYTYRCEYCSTREISIHLLAPVADLLSLPQRSALLASYWCRKGHLTEDLTENELRSIYPNFSAAPRWYRSRSNHTLRCVMCAAGAANYPVLDPNLWAPLGLPTDVLARVLTARPYNQTALLMSNPVTAISPRKSKRLARSTERTAKARARAQNKYDLFGVPLP